MRISEIRARQIYDSRGYPTIEADVFLENGVMGRGAVPSGASTGEREALELRDGGKQFGGKGVEKALSNIKKHLAPAVVGMLADDQKRIDDTMIRLDGTENKSHLGANAILAISLACAHAAANSKKEPLYKHIAELAGNTHFCMPMPMCNIINGGAHAHGSVDFQEFMIVPTGAQDFEHALRSLSETFHALGKILTEHDLSTTVGDEGGYAPHLKDNRQALQFIVQAIETAGLIPGQDISVALDVAASEFYKNERYELSSEQRHLTAKELIAYYEELINEFPIISIEDGLDQNDWEAWAVMKERMGNQIMLVGDDLLVTNTKLLGRAISDETANSILIKPNQIGTLSETIAAAQMAQKSNWNTIMSHRSGETEDTTIAHLAVGLHVPYIKTGSFSRSERLAKYNELLRIGETLPAKHSLCKL